MESTDRPGRSDGPGDGSPLTPDSDPALEPDAGAADPGTDGERPDRLVVDPTLTARFTRTGSGPRGRRFAATYPGAVVAAACLAALAIVVGIRALVTDGSPAAASTGPVVAVTTTGPTSAGPSPAATPSVPSPTTPSSTTASVPSSTPERPTARGTGSPTEAGSTSSRPLTTAVQSLAPAPTGLAAVAGAALVRNPALRIAAQARRQLLAGLVDVRLSTVIATVAAQAALTVDSFQAVRTDPAGSPVRQATVTATDPSQRAAVARALADQAGDYAVATVTAANGGAQTIRLRTVARP